jgi:putative peptide zinc metalloprotease protein
VSESPPPPPARLELLVRRDDGADFEVREVSSTLGFVHLRPRRLPDEAWELAEVRSRVAGEHRFILKNRRTDRFLLLSEPEKFLWEQMDGKAQLQEIATAYVLRYGEFDFAIVPNLIRKLQRAQLLDLAPTSRLRAILARHRGHRMVRAIETTLFSLERVNVSSREVDALFQRLYRWGGFAVFTPLGAVAALAFTAVGVVAAVAFWPHMDGVLAGFGGRALGAILSVKLVFLLTLALHQLVHGLACVHYRRRVREFGFTFLHGFVPTFYVDVTDIFMTSRRARVVTAVSGALVHLVLGAVWFLIAARMPPGFGQAFAAASGILQWQALVIALYPFCFIEMDGYHVLVDVLGVPTLKADALTYVKGLLTGRARVRRGREAALWVVYVVVSALSIVAFVGFNAWLIMHAAA